MDSLLRGDEVDVSRMMWMGKAALSYRSCGDSLVSETLVSDGGVRRDFALQGNEDTRLKRIESRNEFLQIDSMATDGHFFWQ